MTAPADPRSKLFTVELANASLPLVRAIVSDIMQVAGDLVERRRRLDHLLAGRDSEGDVYREELAEVERELEKQAQRLQDYANELSELGVELKGAQEGLVDFPAMMDGRLVYLCWKFDEPEVMHWHELEAGFAGRQPLVVGSIADNSHGDNN